MDKDTNANGEVEYSIKSGRGKGKFIIHPQTGEIFAQRSFNAGQEFDLLVRNIKREKWGCSRNVNL